MKKDRAKKRWPQYLASALIGLALSLAVAFARGLSSGAGIARNAASLSDGFFVAGLLMTGVGALVLVASTDFFDIFTYGFKSLLVLFTPLKKPREHMTFFDYKQERAGRRGGKQFFLLFTGLAFLLLALACLWVYYNC